MPRVRLKRSDRPFDRATMMSRLSRETFDVLVIGGGVTGLGTAVDAATRGLATALVERHDFASGTSSKSSKLVHGGLRYLQQGDVRLVYEALHERQRVMRNAPHLVEVLPFMIPILTRDGLISRKVARALGSALWMYDLTGGLRIGRVHRRLRAARALAHLPTMDPKRLASAYVYYDASADDARLCLALARTAADHGAALANHVEVLAIESKGDTRGSDEGSKRYVVTVRDTNGTFTMTTRSIVNAAGVWVDDVLSKVTSSRTGVGTTDLARSFGTIRPAKGVHVTVPWDLVRNDIAVVIPVPKDRRSLFLVPWGQRSDGTFTHTYVGTTDTDYSGSRDDPQCSKDDIDYIMRALDNALTSRVTAHDVVGTWAGLRPLVVPSESELDSGLEIRTADLSRRHRVSVADDGLVTVTGGKLTTYREMAQDAIDALAPTLGLSIGRFSRHRCRTKRLALHGSQSRPDAMIHGDPSRSELRDHLWHRFGSETSTVLSLADSDPTLLDPLVAGLPYVRAEVVHAVRAEMALTVEDVLSRRTRALLFDRAAARRAARDTALLMAPHLGWDQERIENEVHSFHALCDREEAASASAQRELAN